MNFIWIFFKLNIHPINVNVVNLKRSICSACVILKDALLVSTGISISIFVVGLTTSLMLIAKSDQNSGALQYMMNWDFGILLHICHQEVHKNMV
jgi:hypothetical protein